MDSIIQAPDPRLRTRATATTAKVSGDLLDRMVSIMGAAGGIGLAATQVGEPVRVIVIDVVKLEAYEGVEGSLTSGGFELVNPEVEVLDGRLERWREGCLSVPGFAEDVERPAVVRVSGILRDGSLTTFIASGLLAACVQHEVDHLDGRLFIDRLTPLRRDIISRKLQKLRRQRTIAASLV